MVKDDKYYLAKILSDLSFVIEHTKGMSIEDFAVNEVIQDSVMFRLVQISENSDRLTEDFKALHSEIMWRAMKGMRNRIVHDYGEVDIGIVYRTAINDIPVLHKQLSELLK